MTPDISPDRAAFAERYRGGEAQILAARLADDLLTPVGAYLRLGRDRPNAFLLESVERGNWRGRFSVIGLAPDLIWRVQDGRAEVARGSPAGLTRFTPEDAEPLASLRGLVAASAIDIPDGLPPVAAGLFGYLGYDMVRFIERMPALKSDPVGAPDAVLMRPTIVVVFDALKQELLIASPIRPDADLEADAAYERARARILETVAALRAPGPEAPADAALGPKAALQETMAPETFRHAVSQAKRYIAEGDAFQIVPSQRFETPFDLPPFALYRALRRANPSPFLFHFSFADFAIVGSSPEILVRVRDGVMTSRPIAGTRPRGGTPAEDAANEADLLADPKERAEHLMLVDLSRNDVGRVCKPGSVDVTESFVIERYSTVMHIVSNVEGRLRADADAIDALLAGFPHGTVSGAPKVRAMEIINELEPERRGVYAGGVGYISAGGDMDTCIALRTAVIKDGVMHVRAGAGVVYDSDPESERLETLHKAQALFRAAAEASRFA